MNFNTSAFFNPVFEKTIAENPLKSITFPRNTKKTPTSLLKQCEPSLLPLHTKQWSDYFACCKSYSNPDKDKLPLNPLLARITK